MSESRTTLARTPPRAGYPAGGGVPGSRPVYEAGSAGRQDLSAEPVEEYEPVVVSPMRHPMPGRDAHRAVLARLAD